MLNRFSKEKVFKIPDVRRANECAPQAPAVRRHYLIIIDAMKNRNDDIVRNRQLRLLRGGFEVPVTLSQCERMLEETNASKTC